MLKKIDLRSTLITAVIAAALFCIPVFIYIRDARFKESGLLYIGSFLFLFTIGAHTLRDSRKRAQNESTVALVFASHAATIAGVVLAVFFSLVLLVLLVPGYLGSGVPAKVLPDEPANIIRDKTNGLSFQVFMAATVINFSVGSFASIILPFYSKRNQTKDSREPTPLHQHGNR